MNPTPETVADGTVLFEADVPVEYAGKLLGLAAFRRVRVEADKLTQGGVIVYGMQGWHPCRGKAGRDFDETDLPCNNGGLPNQGERECVRLLLDRLRKAEEELAQLKARFGVVDYPSSEDRQAALDKEDNQ